MRLIHTIAIVVYGILGTILSLLIGYNLSKIRELEQIVENLR